MLVTTRRDLSGVAQHMGNSGYPHLSRLLPPPGICLELYSACATGVLSTFITLVTLSGVVQCMRNRHYSQLSRLLPTAGVCLELRSACATGIIPNYHAYYQLQGSVWSCVAHGQQALFPIITLVTTRRDLSVVAQCMRNRRIIHIYHACYQLQGSV